MMAFAKEHLPIDEIATGPSDELGLALEWNPHSCLDFILQDLGRFPGHGESLVEAGLQSPTVRNHNLALNVLSEWGEDNWSARTRPVLLAALDTEPDVDVRERFQKVLAGEELK